MLSSLLLVTKHRSSYLNNQVASNSQKSSSSSSRKIGALKKKTPDENSAYRRLSDGRLSCGAKKQALASLFLAIINRCHRFLVHDTDSFPKRFSCQQVF